MPIVATELRAYLATSEQPFTVVLLIDVSPSTAFKIEAIQEAAIAFVNQLKAQDSVMVIEFDQGVHVLSKPTNDREKLVKAIRKADFGNGTSLYDAVDDALRKKLSKISGRKAIVLFTDGVDTTSYKHDYDSTLRQAEEISSRFSIKKCGSPVRRKPIRSDSRRIVKFCLRKVCS